MVNGKQYIQMASSKNPILIGVGWLTSCEPAITSRLAYYRRRCGEDFWEYASQMTVNAEWKTIKAFLENTLAKTEWFRDDPPYRKKN
jgi:hypothetical protein